MNERKLADRIAERLRFKGFWNPSEHETTRRASAEITTLLKEGSNYEPPAATVLDWLYANLGGHALAPLTGSDTKALRAAVQIMEQYGYDRHPALLNAFAEVVRRMQPKTRELAYHAIAHPLDWSDRQKVWAGAGLASFTPAMKCSFEPGGSHIDHSAVEAQ